jgi:2-polyprenyl-3-methyl-5-hydroxy-6-metoxy-1,4-benzoquinol methylase
MDQRLLARYVLDTATALPSAPTAGQYLTIEQAESIVNDTVDRAGQDCDAAAYKYLVGHRRRLAISLTFIPIAEANDASFLDVGCYGYMAFWAWKHLGYRRVEGIELLNEAPNERLARQVKVEGDQLDFTVHNFDIAAPEWPLRETFNTVVFLETLEHVNSDPMGVMLNVVGRMRTDSTLVMSVPNSVSYQTLHEFIAGMPPWTYWFFHPDLKHEPRHAFEYTPFVLKFLLRAAGLEEVAFRTICAYCDRKDLDEIFEIGEELSIDPRLFGETMIVQARKNSDLEIVRYPDCIYSNERYYRSTFPVLESKRRHAVKTFLDTRRGREQNLLTLKDKLSAADAQLDELKTKLDVSEYQIHGLESQLAKALFICDRYMTKASAAAVHSEKLEAEVADYKNRVRELEAERSAAEATVHEILNSASWRVTGPVRRIIEPFPRLRLTIRTVIGPLWRVGRIIVRGLR